MLSTTDLERLIAVKRREIEKEKTCLGLSAPAAAKHNVEQDEQEKGKKQVTFTRNSTCETEDGSECKKERDRSKDEDSRNLYDLEEQIPPDLERYIRRYVGLPVMLKAGEYSPNNPVLRAERHAGDVLLALGEYERRRNTLRRLQQQQYKDYLDQQAKKKQEAKEQAEKERREREEKERLREERERERLLLERERRSPVRRPSLNYNNNTHITTKVDTGVQVNGLTRPLSVAVQTDDAELYRVSPWTAPCGMTQAERELSPRVAAEHYAELSELRHKPSPEPRDKPRSEPRVVPTHEPRPERRNSRSELPLTANLMKRSNQDKLLSDLRHQYMPSIFDADAIQLRNLQAEKEAAERRQFYQQELKNQIMEQQRIKEERKSREKLLEQAEMRRLEEQLRMLRVAQERETNKQRDITNAMIENTTDYNHKRTQLQREIDVEQQKLSRVKSQPMRSKRTPTTKSDNKPSKLPAQYPRPTENDNRKPYSINISDNSLFSPNYDVDAYLRRNLNYNLKENDKNQNYLKVNCNDKDYKRDKFSNNIVEDCLPIPVLKHSPISTKDHSDNNNLTDAMKIVDDKWKVPAVQKNILKSLPNDEGKNISILTQLGSIRRQLQLEQMKLDQMLPKDEA